MEKLLFDPVTQSTSLKNDMQSIFDENHFIQHLRQAVDCQNPDEKHDLSSIEFNKFMECKEPDKGFTVCDEDYNFNYDEVKIYNKWLLAEWLMDCVEDRFKKNNASIFE